MSDSTHAAPPPAAEPVAPVPVLPQGPTAVLKGKTVEEMTQALAHLNPHAAARAQENARLCAEAEAAYVKLLKDTFAVDQDLANGGPLVPRARHLELAQKLKDLGWRQYVTVCASHYLAAKTKTGDDPEHFEVATVLRKVGKGSHQACWRVRLEVGEDIDSLALLFAGADWQEREQFDLVGVKFKGHPDLRRLMMPDEWDGHPLRKDYAIETRCVPWR